MLRTDDTDKSGMEDSRELGSPEAAESVLPIVVVPHHLCCVPRRKARPWTRPNQSAPKQTRSAAEGWYEPSIRTAADRGAVRTNFTYRNHFDTSATFSLKAGRSVYAEGPYEGLYQRILATDARTVEYRFQVAEISWTTNTGKRRHYTPDGGRVTEDGREVWFEIKRDQSFFNDPEERDLLDQAEAFLKEHDITLERIAGIDLMDPVRERVIGEILRYKAMPVVKHEEDVASLFEQTGGVTTLGKLKEAISGNRYHAHATACAMLLRRVVGFAVDAPLASETVVWRPKPIRRRLSLHLGQLD